jgi:hypothetical protein
MTADPFLGTPADSPESPSRTRKWLRRAKWAGLVLLVIIVLYYPVGMIVVHRINDDPAFTATNVPQGRQQGSGGGGGAAATRGRRFSLGRQRSVFPAGRCARQHA